jgi:hypothetical protein
LLWAGLAVLLALFGRAFVFLAVDFRAALGFALLVLALLEALDFVAGFALFFALFVFVSAIFPSSFQHWAAWGPGLPVSRNLPA